MIEYQPHNPIEDPQEPYDPESTINALEYGTYFGNGECGIYLYIGRPITAVECWGVRATVDCDTSAGGFTEDIYEPVLIYPDINEQWESDLEKHIDNALAETRDWLENNLISEADYE